MQEWIINIMNQFGYWGIALLIAIENIFPPIPSEIILTFGGFMTTYTTMNMWLVILFATIGSMVGAIVLYSVGRLLTPERLDRLIDKVEPVLRIKKEDVRKAESWFNKRGNFTVFFCRFIPIVRSLISIPAGMASMNFASFLIFTTFGSAIWNVVLVYLGSVFGENWGVIADVMEKYSSVTLVILAIIAIALVSWLIISRKNKKIEEVTSKKN
ncbi:MAG: DedA family protein [Oscillospiraceae bacterium]|nr:DedA family protein [Oscillospiraceae bacterium]